MKVKVEEVPGIKDEVIATYIYTIHNFQPDSVRKSIRNAMRRAEEGPDGCPEVIIALKKGLELPPEIQKLGECFDNVSLGHVVNGSLEIFDPDVTKEQAEAGEEGILLLPLTAVEAMRVRYRVWEPKRRIHAQ